MARANFHLQKGPASLSYGTALELYASRAAWAWGF